VKYYFSYGRFSSGSMSNGCTQLYEKFEGLEPTESQQMTVRLIRPESNCRGEQWHFHYCLTGKHLKHQYN